MKPKTFFTKVREVLHIEKGKNSGALNDREEERKSYINEMEEAIKAQGKTEKGNSKIDKVIRESGEDLPRDISAI